jgi:ELWxxDGT repeat protein
MIPASSARRFALFCLLPLLGCLTSNSQTVTRLTDQVLHTHRSSAPGNFINLNANKVLFTASPSTDTEKIPYVTDGTTAGTLRLISSLPAGTTVVGGFHLLGSHAYFFTWISDAPNSSFWKTDGTPAGTTLVTDQAPREMRSIGVVNGRIVGIGTNYPDEFLWASNGTPQGTGPIFTPPARTTLHSGIAVNGNYILNLAIDTDDGRRDAIWKSNGTSAGTVAVKTLSHLDGATTEYDHDPDQATLFNGSIHFLAKEWVFNEWLNDHVERSVLWKTDGTSGTTQRLAVFDEVYHRMYVFAGSLFLEKNGSVLFGGGVSRPQILRWNGMATGSPVIFTGNDPQPYTGLNRLGEYNGRIYYNATHSNVLRPWDGQYSDLLRMSADGSFEKIGFLPNAPDYPYDRVTSAYGILTRPDGLYLGSYGGYEDVWKISSGIYDTVDRLGVGAVVSSAMIGGHMIGSGNNFTVGFELYSSQSGHTLIADLSPGVDSSDPKYPSFRGGARATLGNLHLFCGADPVAGRELWRSDGTVQGTFRLKDISFGATDSVISYIFPSNGFAWFVVQRGDISPAHTVTELWKTDGTTEGTTFVKTCPDTHYWGDFRVDGNRLVVKKTSNVDYTYSLEILDGTGAGTTIPLPSGGSSNWLLAGNAIWWTESSSPGILLKRSDGSGSPPQTLTAPAGQTLIEFGAAFGDGVVCISYAGSNIYLLWIRPSGSVILRSGTSYYSPNSFREHAGRLYFVENGSLYSTDGTPDSVVLLHSAHTIGNSYGTGMVSHKGSLYFLSSEEYGAPFSVWKTNGTPATTSVTPILFPQGSSNEFLISTGDWLLYPYTYYDSGLNEYIQQVRKSSGLTDGEIIPGMTSTDISLYQFEKYLTPTPAGVVFFDRHTQEDGDELYKLELPSAPPTTSFGIWAENNGLTGPAALPGHDADNDGIPNLVEYFSGTLPNQPSSSSKPAFSTINVSGTPTKVISIPRMPDTGLTLAVETSVDLKSWSRDATIAPNGTAMVATGSRIAIHTRTGSSPETITFSVNPPGSFPKIFVRFRVEE